MGSTSGRKYCEMQDRLAQAGHQLGVCTRKLWTEALPRHYLHPTCHGPLTPLHATHVRCHCPTIEPMADLFSCRATAVLQKASAEQSGLSADVDLRLREDQWSGALLPRRCIWSMKNSKFGQKIDRISNMKYLKSWQNTAKVGETPVVWLWRVTVVGCKCVNHLCKHWTLNAAVKYG